MSQQGDLDSHWSDTGAPYQDESRSSWLPTCLGGCLLVLVVVFVLGALGSWYMMTKGKKMLADLARNELAQAIEESEMAAEDKQKMVEQVDRVVEAFKAGDIGGEEVGRAFEEIFESPIMGLVAVVALKEKYIKPSGLTDEEKVKAELTVQRVARGVLEEKLDMDDLQPAMESIATQKKDDHWELKESVTDEELREFLARCEQLVDEAEIPNEPADINLADEIEKIVDDVLSPAVPDAPDNPGAPDALEAD